MSDDPELTIHLPAATIRLPVSGLSAMLAGLANGRHCDVYGLITELWRQAAEQLGVSAPLPQPSTPEPTAAELSADHTLN